MPQYSAPIDDIKFVLHEILEAESLSEEVPNFSDASRDLMDQILEEGAKICEEVCSRSTSPATRRAAYMKTVKCVHREVSRRLTIHLPRAAGAAYLPILIMAAWGCRY